MILTEEEKILLREVELKKELVKKMMEDRLLRTPVDLLTAMEDSLLCVKEKYKDTFNDYLDYFISFVVEDLKGLKDSKEKE